MLRLSPRVFCAPLFWCFAPVGGVPGGLVVLLLRVLDGVSWRVLNGECLCLWCVFVEHDCGVFVVLCFSGCDCFLWSGL